MGILDKLSGKSLEDKVTEYSDIYGEVLLGLHRDLETQRRLIQDQQQQHVDQAKQIQRLLQDQQQQIVVQAKQIQHLRLLCILSYVFALGIGVAVWIIR